MHLPSRKPSKSKFAIVSPEFISRYQDRKKKRGCVDYLPDSGRSRILSRAETWMCGNIVEKQRGKV